MVLDITDYIFNLDDVRVVPQLDQRFYFLTRKCHYLFDFTNLIDCTWDADDL